jgi:hypothetical protein
MSPKGDSPHVMFSVVIQAQPEHVSESWSHRCMTGSIILVERGRDCGRIEGGNVDRRNNVASSKAQGGHSLKNIYTKGYTECQTPFAVPTFCNQTQTTAYPEPVLRSWIADRADFIEGRNEVAQLETKRLDAGDRFPEMVLRFTDGSTQGFPDAVAGAYRVLLVYRGVW